MRSFGTVTPDTMAWMQKRLGVPFPFLKFKYFQVVAPEYPSAMENISQTTWNTIFLLDETWALEYKHWVDMINCHEMAHSYFGDSVVIRHFDHAWLKESWADYMESCWLEHFKGKDEFEYNLHLCAELYFGECSSYQRPITTNRYNQSFQMYDNHLYPGGARRLHMLRRLLGEDAFWAAVKDYLQTYNWENVKKNLSGALASSTVETDLFRMILEKHSGLNLTAFFDRPFPIMVFSVACYLQCYRVDLRKRIPKAAVRFRSLNLGSAYSGSISGVQCRSTLRRRYFQSP